MRKGITVVLVMVALVAGHAMAATRVAEKPITAGDFVTRVVAALGQDASDIHVARASLVALGVTSDFDPNAALTAGLASRIAGELGVVVATPSAPTATLGASQAMAVVGHISSVVVEGGVSSASEPPTECLSSVNRGACVNCCKTATGLTGQYCGRYCHANVPPPPSPDEPQP